MADNGPNPKIAVVSGFGRLDFDPDTGSVEVEGLGALDVGVSVNGSRLPLKAAPIQKGPRDTTTSIVSA